MAKKRLIRSYAKVDRDDFVSGEKITLREMYPENATIEYGLDGAIKLGKNDLEKLDYPNRVKVVIYSLED